MSALETFSSSAWIAPPPPPFPPSIPIFPMTDETRTPADGAGDWLIQAQFNGSGHHSWRRQRRQLNIPVNNKPRDAQLYNSKQKYFVQVPHDGRIRTTTQSNSLFSIFEVLLWCSLASSPLHPCLSESNESSVFGVILFHFKQTDRYLCLNAKGKLYTSKRTELVDESECAFQHEIVWQNHDIYYSWKYPYNNHDDDRSNTSNQTSTDRSPLPVNAAAGSILTTLSDDPTSGLFEDCRPKWFLGVSGEGRPRTFRRSKCSNLRKNVLFIQRWYHRPSSGQIAFQNPAAGAGTQSPEPGSTARTRNRGGSARRRRPAFQILSGRMVESKTGRGGMRKTKEEDASREKGALCHNLLMNCSPQKKSKHKRPAKTRRKSKVINSIP